MEFKLEYLVPVLGSAPLLLRFLVGLWLALTVVVGVWTSVLYYSQNVQKTAVEHDRYRLNVQRSLDDFSVYLHGTVERHQKEIDRIAQEMNFRGLYSSGPHLKAQYELVKQTQNDINAEWKKITRQIEDLTMERGERQLVDKDLGQRLKEIETKKNEIILQIRQMTDTYFNSRNTFQKQEVEAAGKQILGN